MVKSCCVKYCKSESYAGCGISFHKFPKDEDRKKKWLDIVPSSQKITKNSVVCSNHFKKEDFHEVCSRQLLKEHVIPSIFPLDAIQKLNALQSNKATIEQIKRNLKSGQKCTNIEDMENYLQRVGIPLTKLDELSVIHIAGTKGKGTTSAMCESILRAHGFRTGFYSSPHLVAVRERVRLDGRALTEDAFAAHLHHVHRLLHDSQRFEGDMPKYFAFLTVLALHVFLQERVDVAVVEVGIGGIVDYTNVLRKVPVVGITSLGLDHTSILGDTLAAIAAAKAGIMKRGCDAYTVPQSEEAMAVLAACARETQCTLTIVPNYRSYRIMDVEKLYLPVEHEAYRSNASLAIQLSHAWMRATQPKYQQNGISKFLRLIEEDVMEAKLKNFKNGVTPVDPRKKNGFENGNCSHDDPMESYQNGIVHKIDDNRVSGQLVHEVPRQTAQGLRQCKWPGRYHKIDYVKGYYGTYFLDGAHTKESMEICANWFRYETRNLYTTSILIFSATGDRDAEALLGPLMRHTFEEVFFVIPTAYRVTTQNHDNYSLVEQQDLLERCQNHARLWKKHSKGKVTVFHCVDEALNCIKKHSDSCVLITGSLHLVGAALSILDPELRT